MPPSSEPLRKQSPAPRVTALELCAGGGGQTIGLSTAGFQCVGAVEIDADACATLKLNKPRLNVIHQDLREFDASDFRGVGLVSAGVPCPPFSIAGKQLGASDERDLFPDALRVVAQAGPKAVLFENVRGFTTAKFSDYRNQLIADLRDLGYIAAWRLIQASSYGVSQLRPRFILVALQPELVDYFRWPKAKKNPPTVGECLADLMAARGWKGAEKWSLQADRIAPTIVGGSKKHGGPDLGPTRAKQAWQELRVNGISIGNEAPDRSFPVNDSPRLTNRMVARLQSFPDSWDFAGTKTSQYRQIGNAFPPAVARALGRSIKKAILKKEPPNKPRKWGDHELFCEELVAGA